MIDNTLDERPCLFTDQQHYIISQVAQSISFTRCLHLPQHLYTVNYAALYIVYNTFRNVMFSMYVWHCMNNRRQGNWINRAEPHGSHHFIIVQYALDVRLIMSGEDCINKHMI